jgi:acyl-CoA dehydrogenase
MSLETDLVAEAARGILGRERAARDPWTPIFEGGWIGIGVPEERGGQGGTLVEAAAVAREAGRTAAAAPVVESIMSALMVSACPDAQDTFAELAAGIHRPTLIPQVVVSDQSGCVIDHGLRVPWGRHATLIVVIVALAEGGIGLSALPVEAVALVRGQTLAGEPLDALELEGNQLPAAVHRLAMPLSELVAAGALLTAARIVGALESVAEMSIAYANERRQFGQPIASFQALGHDLVRQSGQVALAGAALAAAVDAVTAVDGAGLAPAARACEVARVMAGQAIPPVTQVAHQVHGAIGVTREHPLHRYTLRLADWRNQYGSHRWWSGRLGETAIQARRWWDDLAPAGSGPVAW